MSTNIVWFRNLDNRKLFILNSKKTINTVPLIGDIIDTSNDDFTKGTFRVKPWKKSNHKTLNNTICLKFKVISRSYCLQLNEWELICEPTSESLLFLLSEV